MPHVDEPSTLLSLVEELQPVCFSGDIRGALDFFQVHFTDFVSSPLRSAILLDMCRGHPLPLEDIKSARVKGWVKEIEKCEGSRRPERCNWRVCFDPQYAGEEFLPDIPPNRPMNLYIYFQLRRWRDSIAGGTLFPRYTHKAMSRETRRAYERSNGTLEGTPIFGQDNWCYHYYKTGEKIGGAMEMRQRWYTSSAKPRTYYAQGGDVYQVARHLQEPFSLLHDALISTHRVFRLLPSRLRVGPNQRYRVYDLSSFTSNFHEQHSFVEELAKFCLGYPVLVADEVEGFIEKDLGEMIMEYNSVCNQYPEVSYERWMSEEWVGIHGIASMLGIFGNLMTCTVAHGIAILQLYADEGSSNVAGDDGLADENDDNTFQLDEIIQSLGEYERTKTFLSNEPGAICLKRPIRHASGRLDLGLAIIPPTSALVKYLATGMKDPRYSFINAEDWDSNKRKSVVGKDLMRFIRSAWRAREILTLDDLFIVYKIYKDISRIMSADGPRSVPYFWPAVPYEAMMLEDQDPLYVTLISTSGRALVMDVHEEVDRDAPIGAMDVGESCLCNMTPHLRWLKMLGIVSVEPVQRLVLGPDTFGELCKLYDSDSDLPPPLYSCTILEPVPLHLV